MSAISRQCALFEELTQDASSALAARGGIKHLDYLVEEWMPLPLWKSWSEWGWLEASIILKIPIEWVIPTTNYLESFNAILKWKHLSAHLHSGYCLHFDLLIHLLIMCILPGIFHHQNAQHEYKKWLASHFQENANEHNLLNFTTKPCWIIKLLQWHLSAGGKQICFVVEVHIESFYPNGWRSFEVMMLILSMLFAPLKPLCFVEALRLPHPTMLLKYTV